jgi:hypothetical protein
MIKVRAFLAKILVRPQNASELATFNLQLLALFPVWLRLRRVVSICVHLWLDLFS